MAGTTRTARRRTSTRATVLVIAATLMLLVWSTMLPARANGFAQPTEPADESVLDEVDDADSADAVAEVPATVEQEAVDGGSDPTIDPPSVESTNPDEGSADVDAPTDTTNADADDTVDETDETDEEDSPDDPSDTAPAPSASPPDEESGPDGDGDAAIDADADADTAADDEDSDTAADTEAKAADRTTTRTKTKTKVTVDGDDTDGAAQVTAQTTVDAQAWAAMRGGANSERDADTGDAAGASPAQPDDACGLVPPGSPVAHGDGAARTIVEVGLAAGASERAMVAALETAIVESGLQNLDDGPSLGVFQQRPSAGWGTAAQLTDPVYAARAFLLGTACANGVDGIGEPGAVARDRTHSGTAGQLAQAVQRSKYSRLYDMVEDEAHALLRRYRDDRAQLAFALTGGPSLAVGKIGDLSGHANGRIPLSALAPISIGHRLRPEAARAWIALQQAATADLGRAIGVTDSYRSYQAQVAVKAVKPTLAATPGKSNHGWGLALDLDTGGWDGTALRWLQANAHRFGWHHPDWAQINGSKPEHWHWEFRGASD